MSVRMKMRKISQMCDTAPYTHPLPRAPHHPKAASVSVEECAARIWASDSVTDAVCRGVADPLDRFVRANRACAPADAVAGERASAC